MKSSVKPLLLNSVLNLETNSDSPSKRSKGVRFSSAKQDKTHKIKMKRLKILFKINKLKLLKLKLKFKIKNIKIKNIKIISYEHICATPRMDLIEVKIELEPQPDHKEGNIIKSETKIKNIKPKLKFKIELKVLKINQPKIDKTKNIKGMISYR